MTHRPTYLLHDNCIEDCCWPTRLANAGGPTPVTRLGINSAVLQGALRSTDDGWAFDFDTLPKMTRDQLDHAEELRLAWHAAVKRGEATTGVRTAEYARSSPELHAAVALAVELGACSPDWVARWLDIDPKVFAPGWFTRPAVDHLLRQGHKPSEIVAISREVWGAEVTLNSVKQRGYRLRLAERDDAALAA